MKPDHLTGLFLYLGWVAVSLPVKDGEGSDGPVEQVALDGVDAVLFHVVQEYDVCFFSGEGAAFSFRII